MIVIGKIDQQFSFEISNYQTELIVSTCKVEQLHQGLKKRLISKLQQEIFENIPDAAVEDVSIDNGIISYVESPYFGRSVEKMYRELTQEEKQFIENLESIKTFLLED